MIGKTICPDRFTPKKVITIGGGSKNSQWRTIREKVINIPIVSSQKTTSFGTALLTFDAKT